MCSPMPRSPLAQDDPGVALGHDVLHGHEPLIQGGVHAPLQHDGPVHRPGPAQQGVILHVAGADLDDVGVLGHLLQGVVVHGLGDDEEPGFLAHLVQDFKPRFPHALVAVRRGAGLVGAAPEYLGPLGLDQAGDGEGLGFAFDGAGPGHDHEAAVPDGHAVGKADDGVLPLHLPAYQLVGLGHGDGPGDAGHVQEEGGIQRAGVAQDADGHPLPPGMGWAT